MVRFDSQLSSYLVPFRRGSHSIHQILILQKSIKRRDRSGKEVLRVHVVGRTQAEVQVGILGTSGQFGVGQLVFGQSETEESTVVIVIAPCGVG